MNGYGSVSFEKDINLTTTGTVQIIDQENRWDTDYLKVHLDNIDSGASLVIGYGPNANNPEIARYLSVTDSDINLKKHGVDNPNQLPLNAVFTGSGLHITGSIFAQAHIVKQEIPKWIQLTAAAAFPAREEFALQVLSIAGVQTMFLMGGLGAGAADLQDVWSSTDGITWAPQGVFPFSARAGLKATVLNNKIIVAGGFDGSYKNDVYSFDGTTWTTLTANAGWAIRGYFGMSVLNNIVYVYGGKNTGGYLDDVWKSVDGITWTQVIAHSGFGLRSDFGYNDYQGRLWVAGGLKAGVLSNEVWSSSDGYTWVQASPTLAFPVRQSFPLKAFNKNKMPVLIAIGGVGTSVQFSDVYTSSDGQAWQPYTTPSIDFSIRNGHQAIWMNNSIYMMGGINGSTLQNDVWRMSVPIV
jgi:hypothetical protein